MSPVIRRATAADAAAIARLDARCFDAPWDAAHIRQWLAGELTAAWCADVGDTLVGALLVRRVAGEGEILRLAVDPAHRRRGFGRALVAQVLDELGPSLPHGLHLEVRASNLQARALYARLGFEDVGRRPAYYAAPVEDAVLMRWHVSLAPSGSGW